MAAEFGLEGSPIYGRSMLVLVLSLSTVPVAALWAYTGRILLLLGQDPEIAAGAGSYIRWMIPALLAYGPLHCHVRFLQTQNIVVPVMLSSGATALNHPLVHGLGMGSKGAALANAVSFLTNLSTWTGFSRAASWTRYRRRHAGQPGHRHATRSCKEERHPSRSRKRHRHHELPRLSDSDFTIELQH
ncbi:MATE efflux family protein [Hordeum vulgare]|nr:MATE efflux family protein [Hordeum vulgare]